MQRPDSSPPVSPAAAASARRFPLLLLLLCLTVLSAAVATATLRVLSPPPPPVPVLFATGAFSFTDEQGQPFGSAELAGKVWVANFVFTRCPTICPAFTAKMARVQQGLSTFDAAARVRLVSFSVDPDHDTPEVLRAYAKKHGATPGVWHFLTGSYPEMRHFVVEGLKVHMDRGADQTDLFAVAHGSHFVLVDPSGQVRGFYDSSDEAKIQALIRDAKALSTLAE